MEFKPRRPDPRRGALTTALYCLRWLKTHLAESNALSVTKSNLASRVASFSAEDAGLFPDLRTADPPCLWLLLQAQLPPLFGLGVGGGSSAVAQTRRPREFPLSPYKTPGPTERR